MVTFKNQSTIKELSDKLFQSEKKTLSKLLPTADIQHVGSTAIPNALTKGDMDINVRVRKNEFDKALGELSNIYDDNKGNTRTSVFASFKKSGLDLPLGIQLTVIDSEMDFFVKQRDFFLAYSEHQKEYDRLKQTFDGKPMSEYRLAKEKFFEKMMKKPEFKKL